MFRVSSITLSLKNLNYIKPYWSKQHGAYITLIVSWFIAVSLSHTISWLQVAVLVFLLSALNFTELIIEAIGRKTRLPERKKFWLIIYSVISVVLLTLLAFELKTLLLLFPAFLVFSLLFVFLALKKAQKSVVAEWLTFGIFSYAGMLAYNAGEFPPPGVLIVVGLLMSSYFGLSIFLVKARLNRLPNYSAMLYSLVVIIILFSFLKIDMFTISLSALFILKSMQLLTWNNWYSKLKIKWIGMLELGYHVVFYLLLVLFSELVLGYHEKLLISNFL